MHQMKDRAILYVRETCWVPVSGSSVVCKRHLCPPHGQSAGAGTDVEEFIGIFSKLRRYICGDSGKQGQQANGDPNGLGHTYRISVDRSVAPGK